jgi:uncharacterized protein DUF3800
MYLVYLDDSRDDSLCVASALVIHESDWLNVFRRIQQFRQELKKSDGLLIRKEWHATDFVSGHGRIADGVVTKGRRAAIFTETLKLLGGLPEFRLFNAVFPRKKDVWAFERLLNRINRAMVDDHQAALLVWDSGKEGIYRGLSRRMSVFNPIPSRFGYWPDSGATTKNIPLDRIIEDPVFKDSAQSYFLQLVDFCAYALLRRENPVESKTKYGLDTAFNNLGPILWLPTTEDDPEGILRLRENPT